MKIKTVAIALVGVPVAGYLLVYAYIWWQTKSDMDQLVKSLSPVAELRYGGIGVSPLGTVSVHDLVVSPRELGDHIRIDRVAVKTPGLDFVLGGSGDLRKGKLPRRLGLSFDGVRIDTSGPIWEMLRKASTDDAKRKPSNGLACDIGILASMTGPLESLTPSQIALDLDMMLETGPAPDAAKVSLSVRQRDLISIALSVGLTQVPSDVLSASAPPVPSAVAIYSSLDPAYAQKALAICAQESGVPAGRFLPALLAQSDQAYSEDIGIVPGPGIRELLRGYLSGEPVEMQFRIPPDFDPSSLKLYKPVDIPRLLELKASLDGKPIDDLSFAVPPSPEDQAQTASAGSASGASGAAPSAQPERPKTLPPANLGSCLGCRVIVTLHDGRQRQGIVDSAANGLVQIKTSRPGGSSTVPVRVSDVAAVRVLGPRETFK